MRRSCCRLTPLCRSTTLARMTPTVKIEPKERRTYSLGLKVAPSLHARLLAAAGPYGRVSRLVEALIVEGLDRMKK